MKRRQYKMTMAVTDHYVVHVTAESEDEAEVIALARVKDTPSQYFSRRHGVKLIKIEREG